jgi:hypothetical protein
VNVVMDVIVHDYEMVSRSYHKHGFFVHEVIFVEVYDRL